MIDLVKRAQMDKPKIQLLADRISAVFVPVVIGIALLTFFLNYIFLHDIGSSIMRSIAVLVIACPCAMGLATPAAIAVGLGRAARNGILFRKADSLELFKKINQVVFDKTGTLTTGSFSIKEFKILDPRSQKMNSERSSSPWKNIPIIRLQNHLSETGKFSRKSDGKK